MRDREDIEKQYLGTPFDRQARIDLWQQKKLSSQRVLILGVGGIGSGILLNVLRLGVAKVYLIDHDVVDIHNLNRQLMYTLEDVGQSKVTAALKNAAFHNIGHTKLEGFQGDALKNWQKIVAWARDSDIVFNCIDWGDKFDSAVMSLCYRLRIPLIMGGTFAVSMSIDFFGPHGVPCYLCSDDSFSQNAQLLHRITPDIIGTLQDLSFLPRNNNPIGRSSVVVCTICVELMVSHYLNFLFLAEEKEYKASRMIFYHNTFEIIKFDIDRNLNCLFCKGEPVLPKPVDQSDNIEIGEAVTVGEKEGKQCIQGESVQAAEKSISSYDKTKKTLEAVTEEPTKTLVQEGKKNVSQFNNNARLI